MNDGNWYKTDYKEARKYLTGYKNEAHFCNVLESNIELVCRIAFNEKYITHKREFEFRESRYKGPVVDFLITTDKSSIALECKNPKNRGSQAVVYQLLKYKILGDSLAIKIDKLVLFTTEFTAQQYDLRIIKEFNLPIEIFFVSNEKIFTIAKCPNQN